MVGKQSESDVLAKAFAVSGEESSMSRSVRRKRPCSGDFYLRFNMYRHNSFDCILNIE